MRVTRGGSAPLVAGVIVLWLVVIVLAVLNDRRRGRSAQPVKNGLAQLMAAAYAYEHGDHGRAETLLTPVIANRDLMVIANEIRHDASFDSRQQLREWPAVYAVLLQMPAGTGLRALREGLRGALALQRGKTLMADENLDAAELELVRAVDQMSPLSPSGADRARFQLSMLAALRSEHDDAVRGLEEIVRRSQPSLAALDAMVASERVRAGRTEGAVPILDAAARAVDGTPNERWVAMLVEALVAEREVDRAVREAHAVLDRFDALPRDEAYLVAGNVALTAGQASVAAVLVADLDTAEVLLDRALALAPESKFLLLSANKGVAAYVSALSYPTAPPSDPVRAGGTWHAWAPDIARDPDPVARHLAVLLDAALVTPQTLVDRLHRCVARLLVLGGDLDAGFEQLALARRASRFHEQLTAVAYDECIARQRAGDDEGALRVVTDRLDSTPLRPRTLAGFTHERAALLARLGDASAGKVYARARQLHLDVGQPGDADDCTANLAVLSTAPPAWPAWAFASGTFGMCWPVAEVPGAGAR